MFNVTCCKCDKALERTHILKNMICRGCKAERMRAKYYEKKKCSPLIIIK